MKENPIRKRKQSGRIFVAPFWQAICPFCQEDVNERARKWYGWYGELPAKWDTRKTARDHLYKHFKSNKCKGRIPHKI